MKQKENRLLSSPEVDKLVILIEEATRATTDSPRRFIEPARGTLDRSKSKRHHLIFGRRGSGKTSLIKKAGSDLTIKRIPSAFIDLEAFKGHAYPDVLLSILIETLGAFDQWLETAGLSSAKKTSFWKFFGKPERSPFDRKKVAEVREALRTQMDTLKKILHSEDGAKLTARATTNEKLTVEEAAEAKMTASCGGIAVTAGGSSQTGAALETENEIIEASKRNKVQFLLQHIIDFQKLFQKIVSLTGTEAFVFLDDLYHIRRSGQAHVLDYFHGIVKGRQVWLKVGTIRHRTEWYHHGNPPIGLKLADDCDDIDLDVTLEKYELAKNFLLKILDQLVKEAGLESHEKLLSEGGIERLVLASGGVARDFLTIFRRTIDIARERGETFRGEKINAEDVNQAAGEHDAAKRDELKRDTLEEQDQLKRALKRVQDFCIKNKVNCFLVERDTELKGHEVLGELVDLRFVHVVESRTSVRDIPGKLYTAYMLDISQYTGARTRRDLEMISFWKREELDKIRRSPFVLDVNTLTGVQGHT